METVSSPPRLRATPEAAEHLGVNKLWLKRQATAGLVQHTRIGRRVMFSDADLDAIIAARVVKPTNQP